MSKRVLILLAIGLIAVIASIFLLKYEMKQEYDEAYAEAEPEPKQRTRTKKVSEPEPEIIPETALIDEHGE